MLDNEKDINEYKNFQFLEKKIVIHLINRNSIK